MPKCRATVSVANPADVVWGEVKEEMNKVILIGRVGADPDTKYTESGSVIATVRLATNNRRNKDGSDAPPTWHTLKFFGRTAETVGEHVKKGREIAVEGRINNDSYKDKEGQAHYFSEVIVDNFEFIGPKPAED